MGPDRRFFRQDLVVIITLMTGDVCDSPSSPICFFLAARITVQEHRQVRRHDTLDLSGTGTPPVLVRSPSDLTKLSKNITTFINPFTNNFVNRVCRIIWTAASHNQVRINARHFRVLYNRVELE